ncbi:phosphatidylethanolamine-binding protein pebp, partial [Colletotrichum asianum]
HGHVAGHGSRAGAVSARGACAHSRARADGAGVRDAEEVARDDLILQTGGHEGVHGVEVAAVLGGARERHEALLGDLGVVDGDEGVAMAEGLSRGRVGAEVGRERRGVHLVLHHEDRLGTCGRVEDRRGVGGGETSLHPVEQRARLRGLVGRDVNVHHHHGVLALQLLLGRDRGDVLAS